MNNFDKKNWQKYKFGDIAKEVRIAEPEPLKNGLSRYIGLEHINPENLHIESWGDIADGTTFSRKFVKGQVLFGRRRAYLKKAALANFDGICSGDILVFEAVNDKLLPELLPFIVQNDNFFQYAVDASAGSLSPRVKFKDLAKFELMLPESLDEQKKLADLLWTGDELNRKYGFLEKELAVYNQAFTKQILKNGKMVMLKDIANIRRGASPRPIKDPKYFSNSGVGWVRIADVQIGSKYLKKTRDYLSDLGVSKSVMVNPGDVILSICATIGRPVIVDMNACIHDGFVLFSNYQEFLHNEYLFYFLDSIEEKLNGLAQQGTQNNLNTTIVGNLKIPLFPLEEQKEIVKKLNLLRKVHIRAKKLSENSINKHLANQIFANG